VKKII